MGSTSLTINANSKKITFCIQSDSKRRTESNPCITNIQASYVGHSFQEPGGLEVLAVLFLSQAISSMLPNVPNKPLFICRMGWRTPTLCLQGRNQYVQCLTFNKEYLLLSNGSMISVMAFKKLVFHKRQATSNMQEVKEFLMCSEIQHYYLKDCSSRIVYALCLLARERHSWVLQRLWNSLHGVCIYVYMHMYITITSSWSIYIYI